MRRLLGTASAIGLLVATACSDPVSSLDQAAPDLARGAAQANDGYIVVFNASAGDPGSEAAALARAHGGQVRSVYRNVLRGFAVRGLTATAAEAIGRNPRVAYVEPDAEARLFVTQSNATWGIDRVDQRNLPLSGSYTYNFTANTVNAYIFDTGIRLSHNEFGNRAQYVPNGSNGNFVGDAHGSAADCHGHGTHVAGTVGGSTYGVAKSVKLWAGRVVNCSGSGTASMLIAALDWCDAGCVRPAVVNMSLGYGNVQSIRAAVEDLSSKGVTSVVAAGNGSWPTGRPIDACGEAPAGAPSAITVGATSSSDTEASFSNYGTCVDILAPGVNVTSAGYGSNAATATMSGTSMATPHVVGAVALYLSEFGQKTPQQVSNALTSSATPGKIALHSRSVNGGTPNLLLYTLGFGGSTPTNSPPTAAFTYSCIELACSFNGSGSTDPDGTIASYAWNFGDGSTATGATVSHSYASAGTRNVTLTVTDNGGLTDNEVKSVTVSSAPTGGLTLSASGYKVKGVHTADLTWSGASSATVDIYRNTTKFTTANDGEYTDNIGARGGGSYTYRVCEAGTSICSSNVTVTF
jgi:subtilisin family serine protease